MGAREGDRMKELGMSQRLDDGYTAGFEDEGPWSQAT